MNTYRVSHRVFDCLASHWEADNAEDAIEMACNVWRVWPDEVDAILVDPITWKPI